MSSKLLSHAINRMTLLASFTRDIATCKHVRTPQGDVAPFIPFKPLARRWRFPDLTLIARVNTNLRECLRLAAMVLRRFAPTIALRSH